VVVIDMKHGNDPLRFAARVHRISGVALALFLPLHFLVLAMALNGAEHLDSFLAWSQAPLVKVAEAGVVLLLSLHLFGGLRLLALEFLPWSPRQKTFAASAAAVSVLVSIGFFLNAV
jgi:fumarate reductase subunit D